MNILMSTATNASNAPTSRFMMSNKKNVLTVVQKTNILITQPTNVLHAQQEDSTHSRAIVALNVTARINSSIQAAINVRAAPIQMRFGTNPKINV